MNQAIALRSRHRHDHECSHDVHWWTKSLELSGRGLMWCGLTITAAGFLMSLLSIHTGLICPLRALTGIPCPFCGMTTSVRATTRFDFARALEANPGGLLLVGALAVLVATRPRWVRLPVLLGVAVVAGLWVFELNRFAII